jgi:cellulose synthase (UDP-forming)
MLVIVNVILGLWYFEWLLRPSRIGTPELYVVLVAAELFGLFQAVGFWWTVMRAKAVTVPGGYELSDGAPWPLVDVLIPVYTEPVEIVAPTVAAAVRAAEGHSVVYVLDDKGRPELEDMASSLGARYIHRERHVGAKAGNLNHALGLTGAPFVAVFDCDHVAQPDFLSRTLQAFDDPRVAFVQTPQYYANAADNHIAAAAWAQQALFFGPIAQGKGALNVMFCCGTNVVLRRAALEEAGGFPEDSITEDFVLSIGLQERGWRSVYLSEVLAQGLGPEDAASYVSQQRRWSRGCIGAIPRVVRSKMAPKKKLQFLLSASYFLTGWTLLIYFCFPILRITFGIQPIARAGADQFLLHFVPYYACCLATVATAGRGRYTFSAYALYVANFWIHVESTIAVVTGRTGAFAVTPKQGAGVRQPRAVAPALGAAGVLVAAAIGGIAVSTSPGTLNNVAFALFHATLLAAGAWPALIRQAPRRREAIERRELELQARDVDTTQVRPAGELTTVS